MPMSGRALYPPMRSVIWPAARVETAQVKANGASRSPDFDASTPATAWKKTGG